MYYSQIGQDKWVEDVYKGKRGGFFVDIGAYDGMEISNTLHLEQDLDWKGVCVEPLPEAFSLLRRNRTCACENVCITKFGDVAFLKRRGKGSTIVGGVGRKTVVCIAARLAEVLDRNHVPAEMEYLSLDIEGLELDVIETFPFDRYGFGAMTIEHNAHLGEEQQRRREKMLQVLSAVGYERVMEVKQDDWYVNKSILGRLLS